MMIGDQHLDAARGGFGNAVVAGDPVVDGHDEPRLTRRCFDDDLARQSVAIVESVGDQKIDHRAHRRQPAHGDCARGGAVGIVIGDHEDALAARDRIGETRCRGVDAHQQRRGGELREMGVELLGRRHAACREYARQHRMDARRRERSRRGRDVAPDDFH